MERQRGRRRALLVKAFSRRPHTAAVMTGLLVLTFVVFSPALKNGFVNWDDDVYVLNNPRIQSLNPGDVLGLFVRPYYANYIPLTLLSHAIDYGFWKSNPWGHHLTNVLLHCLNSVWVFILTLVLLVIMRESSPRNVEKPAEWFRGRLHSGMVAGGAFAALLFAFHPLRVESVSWISDRKDLLCAAFLLPSTIAYLISALRRGEHRRSTWYLLSLLLFAFAVLSKPIAIVAPALFWGLDLLAIDLPAWRRRWRGILTGLLPFLLISCVVGVLTIALGESGKPNIAIRDLGPTVRWLLPISSMTFYLEKIVWPVRLLPVYSAPELPVIIAETLAAIVLTVAAIVLLWMRRPSWFLSWCAYGLFILSPFVGIGAGAQPWADRYSYLGAVSLCIFCGGALTIVWKKTESPGSHVVTRIASISLPIILIALLMLGTLAQLKIWKNSESLWSYTVAQAPTLPTPYNSLGAAYADLGQYDRALIMYQRAIDLDPTYHRAYANLGMLYGVRGDTAKAKALFVTARRLRPDYVEAYTGLGTLYLQQSRFREALIEYDAAISLDPTLAKAWYNKGLAYYQLGARDSALIMFEATVRFEPRYTNAYLNAAVLYNEKGETKSAIEMFTKAARLGSTDAQRFLKSKGIEW